MPSYSRIEHFGISDIGLRRANNQDAYAEVPAPNEQAFLSRGHLFLVADGMGAHAAGELASKIAAESVPHIYGKIKDAPPHEAIRRAILETNQRIHEQGQANPDFHGMGTTCTALVILPGGAIAAHVGDSRLYRVRAKQIEQLSFDHSLVWEMNAASGRREDELASHIPKNIITRSLGPNADLEVDLEGPYPLQKGDIFLLCSDGLSGQVTDQEIGVLLRSMSIREALTTLVDMAKLRGGPDNITVVAVQVTNSPAQGSNGQGPQDTDVAAAGTAPNPISPMVWGGGILLGVGLLLSFLIWTFANSTIGAAAIAIASVAASLWLILQPRSSAMPLFELPSGRMGKGPYSRHDCTPSRDFVTQFVDMFESVRSATAGALNEEDKSALEAFGSRARRAAKDENWPMAVRELAGGIRHAMAAIEREDREGARDESPIS